MGWLKLAGCPGPGTTCSIRAAAGMRVVSPIRKEGHRVVGVVAHMHQGIWPPRPSSCQHRPDTHWMMLPSSRPVYACSSAGLR